MNKKWIASLACVCLLASSFTAAVAEGMKPGTWRKVNDREMAELQELLKDSKN